MLNLYIQEMIEKQDEYALKAMVAIRLREMGWQFRDIAQYLGVSYEWCRKQWMNSQESCQRL